MIVNRYKKGIRETTKIFVMGTRRRERAVEAKYIKGICDFLMGYDFGHPTPPKRIEIETINKCNGECSFCPANRHEDIRPLLKMDENIFYKIIGDLASWDYKGRLGLHSNNEPLLDTRIIDFSEYARKHLPEARIYMYTNGTLMNMDKLKALMKWLSYIVIDNYNDALKLNPNIEEIDAYIKQDEDLNNRVEIHLRKQHEVLSTRGGISPNNQGGKELTYSCYMPFVQMVFRPDGKVSQCCCDVYAKKTMGDVMQSTIKEIWESDKYKNLRRVIAKGRNHIDICRICDMKMNAK